MSSTQHHALLFGVRRSIRYHSRRQAFYESVDRWTNFALLLLGSGATVLAFQGRQTWILAVGFGVTFVSSLKLVYAFGAKAGQHAQFVKDFTRLEERLVADGSDETVTAVTQERLQLEASEPPVMRVLDALCHNELLVAMGYSDEKERVPLTWLQRLTANILNFGESALEKAR